METTDFASPTNFDIKQADLHPTPQCRPLTVTTVLTLDDALGQQIVTPDTALVVMDRNGAALAFETTKMVYHHIAQGEFKGEPFFVSFCAVCNGAAAFSALVDGQVTHFAEGGMYNAMMLMRDDETGSYWDHIHGTCLHGPRAGTKLTPLTALLHTTAAQAKTTFPGIQIAISTLSAEESTAAQEGDDFRRNPAPDFTVWAPTLGKEDPRLPRLDMGLGVWITPTQARYYSMKTLHAHENYVLDTFDGRRLLVAIDPTSGYPAAYFVDTKSARWFGENLRLDNGLYVKDGAIFNATNEWQMPSRPNQLWQRWFGFSATFPGCEIYQA